MGRKISAVAGAIICLFAALGAHAAPLIPIKVGYTNTTSVSGLFIATSEGMFARRGLDVSLLLLSLNSNIPSALIGGSVQIGSATPSVMLQAVDGGLDIVAICGAAAINTHSNLGSGVVARNGVNIKTAKDFEGKRVGVPGIGAFMHVSFRRWLTEHGANDRKVNFVEVPLAQASDILRAGNVDAVVVGEPFFSRVMQAKTGYLVSPFFNELPDGLFQMYYTANRDWAIKNPAVIKAFREALDEAAEFLAKQPEKSRAIIGKATRLPPDVVAAIMLPTLRTRLPVSDTRYWAETLLTQGIIRKIPDVEKLVIN